jgi:CubicO group peptidase (beta-lactamase class C family)
MIDCRSRRDILRTTAKLAVASSVGTDYAAIARAEGPKVPRSDPLSQVDTLLRAAASEGTVPGVVALVATDTSIVYEGVFGSRRIKGGSAMTRDTVFRIASMIKPITSVAAMQLVEQNKLSLDSPVPDIDAALAKPQVLDGFDAGGAPRLRTARRPISLRHLLTHTAGCGMPRLSGISKRSTCYHQMKGTVRRARRSCSIQASVGNMDPASIGSAALSNRSAESPWMFIFVSVFLIHSA